MIEAQRVKTLCFFHWPQPFWGFRFRWVNRVCLKQKTGLPASSNPKVARPIRSVAQIYTPTEPLLESKVVTQHMGLGGDRMPMDTSKIQWLIIIYFPWFDGCLGVCRLYPIFSRTWHSIFSLSSADGGLPRFLLFWRLQVRIWTNGSQSDAQNRMAEWNAEDGLTIPCALCLLSCNIPLLVRWYSIPEPLKPSSCPSMGHVWRRRSITALRSVACQRELASVPATSWEMSSGVLQFRGVIFPHY